MRRKVGAVLLMIVLLILFTVNSVVARSALTGDKIAFSSNRDGNYEVYIMDADGSNQQRLTDDKNKADDWFPVWSPNGQQLLYSSGTFETGYNL